MALLLYSDGSNLLPENCPPDVDSDGTVLNESSLSQNRPKRFAKKQLMSTFLLSYYLYSDGREFGNEFLIMAAHGTLNGFVLLQTFQCLLT